MSSIGIASCSTAGNPLNQLSKIGSNDNSLQRDNLAGTSLSTAQGMRNIEKNGSQDHVNMLWNSGYSDWKTVVQT